MRLFLLINFLKISLQSSVFTAIETNKVLKYWRKIKWKNPFQPLTIWPQLEQPQWSYISILSTRAHIALPIVCPILQGGEFLWENLQNRETLVYSWRRSNSIGEYKRRSKICFCCINGMREIWGDGPSEFLWKWNLRHRRYSRVPNKSQQYIMAL